MTSSGVIGRLCLVCALGCTIAEPGCRLDPEHYDPTALRLLCEQDDARVRMERYQDGRREPWTACGP